MKITSETSLRNFEFWSGGKDNASELTANQLDEVEAMIVDLYPDGISDGELNDLFWFDFEQVKQWLGIEDDSEEEED